MKVWITKYALTVGIEERNVEPCSDTMIKASALEYYHKPNWHATRETAVKQAEYMRLNKIKSLERSLAKMKKLHFE